MDITKFNQELGRKVAKAKVFEKHNDLKKAIELWLEISEMAINLSKKPGLEFTFKNMLISKTEQIFQHIRDLKSPKKREIIIEDIIPPEEINTEVKVPQMKVEATSISKSEEVESKGLNDDNWMDKIDFSEPPKGVVEIKPSEEFKIITPHDPDYVEKMKKLSEEKDMGNLMQREKPKNNKVDNNNKTFCFTCGAEIEPNAKICKECGTDLK